MNTTLGGMSEGVIGVSHERSILGLGYGALYGSVPKDCHFFKVTQMMMMVTMMIMTTIIVVTLIDDNKTIITNLGMYKYIHIIF